MVKTTAALPVTRGLVFLLFNLFELRCSYKCKKVGSCCCSIFNDLHFLFFQEFLRRLPDCIFESENYEDLVATTNLEDREERVRQIKG